MAATQASVPHAADRVAHKQVSGPSDRATSESLDG
jgi:hypothetical protein